MSGGDVAPGGEPCEEEQSEGEDEVMEEDMEIGNGEIS